MTGSDGLAHRNDIIWVAVSSLESSEGDPQFQTIHSESPASINWEGHLWMSIDWDQWIASVQCNIHGDNSKWYSNKQLRIKLLKTFEIGNDLTLLQGKAGVFSNGVLIYCYVI